MVTLESVLEYHNMRTAMAQVIKNWGWLSIKEAYERGFIDCDLSEPPTA